MLRTTIVLLMALLASLSMLWLSTDEGRFGLAYLGDYSPSYFLGRSVVHILQELLPGFIVGALLQSRQLLAGALVSGVSVAAAIAIHYYQHSQEFEGWIKFLVDLVEPGFFGLAAAALGLVALGSNNSFQRTAGRILGSSTGR